MPGKICDDISGKEALMSLRLDGITFYEFKNMLRERTQPKRKWINERTLLMLDKWMDGLY
jgi:hypothetical protein